MTNKEKKKLKKALRAFNIASENLAESNLIGCSVAILKDGETLSEAIISVRAALAVVKNGAYNVKLTTNSIHTLYVDMAKYCKNRGMFISRYDAYIMWGDIKSVKLYEPNQTRFSQAIDWFLGY